MIMTVKSLKKILENINNDLEIDLVIDIIAKDGNKLYQVACDPTVIITDKKLIFTGSK